MCSLVMACVLAIAITPVAWAGTVGVYSDSACTSCDLRIGTNQTEKLYVGLVGEPLANGRNVPMECEFSVAGVPEAWIANATAIPPGIPLLGEDILHGGGGVGFFSEYDASGPCVLLYTIELTATTLEPDVTIRVEGGHDYDCPYFAVDRCVGPEKCPVEHCAGGGVLFVNSLTGCLVGIEQRTWSTIKQLYD